MKKSNQELRIDIVRKAALIALIGNLFLAIIKIIAGITQGSLAVLGDGIDSSSDVAIALMTLAVGFIIAQPSDKKHPWGHTRAETIATIVLAIIILFAAVQLFQAAFMQLIKPTKTTLPSASVLVVTAVSIIGKLLLAFNQHKMGKKAESAMIIANAKNMTNDIIISTSVFIGVGLSILFKISFLDPLVAMLVSLWVFKSAIEIFLELNTELMDGTSDDTLYKELFKAVKTVPGAGNPHRARIRKMASSWDIDLDIEVDGKKTVTEAHEIAGQVEAAIRASITDVYDIMVHVEPAGNGEHDEQYGVCEKDITSSKPL